MSKRKGVELESPQETKKPRVAAPWQRGLLDSMKDPEKIVKSNELTVVIRDAYPKARHHFLVLPNQNISDLRALNSTHLSLLEKILEDGKTIADDVKKSDNSASFKYGYHASPSMTRLHMHVISQDFNSPCLKNKKHWNSFTTDFFMEAEKVISILRDKGKVDLDVKGFYEPMLKQDLRCHVCHEKLKNIPKLKEHILKHDKNK